MSQFKPVGDFSNPPSNSNAGDWTLKSNIVVISRDLNLVERLKKQLPDEQVSWLWAGDGRLGLDVISHVPINIAVVDSSQEDQKDLELIGAIKASEPDVQVMMATPTYSREQEIDVRRLGAHYCVTNGEKNDSLYRFVAQAAGLSMPLSETA